MPTWPAGLPQTPLQQYEEEPPKNLIRTEMDAGPAKVRKRFTAGVRVYRVTYLLDGADITTLDNFFITDTEFGALSFNFPHPRTGTTISVRFVRSPRYSGSGALFGVSMEIEELP